MDISLDNLIHNHKDICETFKFFGIDSALQLVEEKYYKIIEANPDNIIFCLNSFLNSLNKAIYHYIIFQTPNSSENCIYYEFKYYSATWNLSSFLSAARNIMNEYIEFLNTSSNQNKHIENACNYIQNHIAEDLSLEKVADSIYVSRCYLCQIFKAYKKINFSEYVNNERVSLAKILLAENKVSIDNISQQCGFSSPSYFSTVFKKNTGMSPREFKKFFSKQIAKNKSEV